MASRSVNGEAQQGLNSIIILGAWTIWKHQNDCMFNGASPGMSTSLNMAREEVVMWSMAGAKGLVRRTA